MEKMDEVDNEQNSMVCMLPSELEAMVERASLKAARQALSEVGLNDDEADNDVRDLRALIRDWRTIRAGILRALGKVILWGILALIAAFGIKTGVLDNVPGSSQ